LVVLPFGLAIGATEPEIHTRFNITKAALGLELLCGRRLLAQLGVERLVEQGRGLPDLGSILKPSPHLVFAVCNVHPGIQQVDDPASKLVAQRLLLFWCEIGVMSLPTLSHDVGQVV